MSSLLYHIDVAQGTTGNAATYHPLTTIPNFPQSYFLTKNAHFPNASTPIDAFQSSQELRNPLQAQTPITTRKFLIYPLAFPPRHGTLPKSYTLVRHSTPRPHLLNLTHLVTPARASQDNQHYHFRVLCTLRCSHPRLQLLSRLEVAASGNRTVHKVPSSLPRFLHSPTFALNPLVTLRTHVICFLLI